MLRRVAFGIVIACVLGSVAHAQKPKVLVLPLAASSVELDVARAFDARLLVALEDTGRVSTLTPSEEPACTTHECLASLGVDAGAAFVLFTSVVRERGGFTLFGALVDCKTGATARRVELPSMSSDALARTAPVEVARQLAPPASQATVVGVVRPASGAARTAADAITARLAALRTFAITAIEAGRDRVAISHRGEITIDQLAVVERRHHVRRYRDGTLVATFSIIDLRDRRVVFTKTVQVTVSRRARYSSTPEITALLVDAAVTEWMTAFRTAGVEPRLRGGTR